jgi:RNA polymerase sigma factor (sigma-70 family)
LQAHTGQKQSWTMRDIHTDPDDSGHDSKFIFDETIDYSAPKFRGQADPNPSNLTERRWREPILSPGEVADNLRAARGPEPAASAAKNTLAQSFSRLVLKEAKPYCRDDGRNDDLIAAGMLGLAEAIDGFDLNRNNGLAAYAKQIIRKRLKETSKSFNRNGWAGETRLQREVYSNHDLTPERASKVMGRPVDQDEIERARTEVLGMCSPLLSYDTTEPGFEDDEERRPGVVTVAPICTKQRDLDAALEQRHGSLEWLAEDADRRARQRLKEIGRRAYALELVARDRARAAPVAHLFIPPEPSARRRGYRFEEQPKALPRKPAQELRKLGGRIDRSATTYHAMRAEAFDGRSPTHRRLTGHAPPREVKVHTPQPNDLPMPPKWDRAWRRQRGQCWSTLYPRWGYPKEWRATYYEVMDLFESKPAALAA